jgi:hypothetical protein
MSGLRGLTVRPIPEPRRRVRYVSVDSVNDALGQVVALGGPVLHSAHVTAPGPCGRGVEGGHQ